MTPFERDLAAFRKHAKLMRAEGYCHVSVKYGNKEYHVEGPPANEEKTPAVGGGIGFQMDEEEDD